MKLSDYMEEVVKECSDLERKRYQDSYDVVNKEGEMVICGTGDCNFKSWNYFWLHNNVPEFINAGSMSPVMAQELFPEPKEFVKFYKKARKNGKIDYLKGSIEFYKNEINALEQELENTINKLKELEGE